MGKIMRGGKCYGGSVSLSSSISYNNSNFDTINKALDYLFHAVGEVDQFDENVEYSNGDFTYKAQEVCKKLDDVWGKTNLFEEVSALSNRISYLESSSDDNRNVDLFYYNIKDYYEVGDTNYTAAFGRIKSEMLNHPSNAKRIIYFPCGEYELDSMDLPENVVVIGELKQGTIIKKAYKEIPADYGTYTSGSSTLLRGYLLNLNNNNIILNVTLDGNKESFCSNNYTLNSTYGNLSRENIEAFCTVSFSTRNNIILDNCVIKNSVFYNCRCYKSHYVTIKNCEIAYSGPGPQYNKTVTRPSNVEEGAIIAADSTHHEGASALSIAGEETDTDNIVVENCYIHDNYKDGISISRPYVIIKGCNIVDNGNGILYATQHYGNEAISPKGACGIFMPQFSSYAVIENNNISTNSGFGIELYTTTIVKQKENDATKYEAEIRHSDNVKIIGNNFYRNGRQGIQIRDARYCIITDNIFVGNRCKIVALKDEDSTNIVFSETSKGYGDAQIGYYSRIPSKDSNFKDKNVVFKNTDTSVSDSYYINSYSVISNNIINCETRSHYGIVLNNTKYCYGENSIFNIQAGELTLNGVQTRCNNENNYLNVNEKGKCNIPIYSLGERGLEGDKETGLSTADIHDRLLNGGMCWCDGKIYVRNGTGLYYFTPTKIAITKDKITS